MSNYGYVSEQSRKSKTTRALYEFLKANVSRNLWKSRSDRQDIEGHNGIPVPLHERHRVLALRLHDEHLSPYFKTDMNLFHLLMMDESIDVVVFESGSGWLLEFEGLPTGPKPFGQQGHDTR